MGGDNSSASGDGDSWWSRMSRSEQILAAVFPAIIAAIAAVTVALINHSSGSSSNSSPGVSSTVAASASPSIGTSSSNMLTFNKPSNWEAEGKVVSVTLTGTVPRGEHLWIFVHHAGNYYVQGPPTYQGTNLWSLSAVNLGSSLRSDLQSWYTIYAVLANSQANKAIQAEYRNPNEVNFGMSRIPGGSGVKKAASIKLFRTH